MNTPSTVYVLYARRPDMPDHLEDIITETTDLDHLDKARLWATANGFVAPRVTEFTPSPADFDRMVQVFGG